MKDKNGLDITANTHAAHGKRAVLITSFTELRVDDKVKGLVQYASLEPSPGNGFPVEMFDAQGNRVYLRVVQGECPPEEIEIVSPQADKPPVVQDRTPGQRAEDHYQERTPGVV